MLFWRAIAYHESARESASIACLCSCNSIQTRVRFSLTMTAGSAIFPSTASAPRAAEPPRHPRRMLSVRPALGLRAFPIENKPLLNIYHDYGRPGSLLRRTASANGCCCPPKELLSQEPVAPSSPPPDHGSRLRKHRHPPIPATETAFAEAWISSRMSTFVENCRIRRGCPVVASSSSGCSRKSCCTIEDAALYHAVIHMVDFTVVINVAP